MLGGCGHVAALLILSAAISCQACGLPSKRRSLATEETEPQLPRLSGQIIEEIVTEFSWPVTEEIPLPKIQVTETKCHRKKRFKPYVILVAGLKYDANWAASLGDDVEAVVYQQADKEAPHYFPHLGHEAAAYIQFMIDYYDCLPNVTAFVHGHEAESWHSLNMTDTMSLLQWDKIPGYTDLNRKVGIWHLEMRKRPKYPSRHPVAMGEDVYTGGYTPQERLGGRAWEEDEILHHTQFDINIRAYDNFFGPLGLGAMPHTISYKCCPQFAVTRERIQFRSRLFWLQNMHFMQHNDVQAGIQTKSHMIGDIWTIYWPMLFGESAEYREKLPAEELFKTV